MGLLALRPGDSLAILLDGFVNRLQDSQFPSFLLFKLRGLNSYPDGTFTHCSCQPSLDAHFRVLISQINQSGDRLIPLRVFDGLLNLPPDPNSEHQAGSMDRLAGAACEYRCLVKRTRIGETDVWGKFTRDLVTKPYAAVDIG
jgi:hypothetical protein